MLLLHARRRAAGKKPRRIDSVAAAALAVAALAAAALAAAAGVRSWPQWMREREDNISRQPAALLLLLLPRLLPLAHAVAALLAAAKAAAESE